MLGAACATLLALAPLGDARAQMPADGALAPLAPLAPLVSRALRENLALRAARLDDASADAQLREARGLHLPTVTLDTRRSRLDRVLDVGDLVNPAYRALNQLTNSTAFPTNVSSQLPFAQETHLRLTQSLYDGAIGAAVAARRAGRDARVAETSAAARQLAADVQLAYLAYASATRATELHESTLTLVDEQRRVAERLLAAGSATPDAVLRARADRDEVAQTLADSRAQQLAARRALNELLARPLDDAVPLVPDSALDAPLPNDVNALVRSGLDRREELAQLTHGIDAARAQQRGARAAFLPSLGVGVDYGTQGREYRWTPDRNFLVVSVVGSLNLYRGGQDDARRDRATLDVERLRTQRDDAARRIELDVRTAYESARVAHDAIATAESRERAMERTHALVRRKWEQGLAPQIELLDARAAYTRAALNTILTRYAYASRRVQLERAAALRDLAADLDR